MGSGGERRKERKAPRTVGNQRAARNIRPLERKGATPPESRPEKHPSNFYFGFVAYAPAFFCAVPPSSWIALRALERTSGGMLCMLCVVLACSAAFLRTSSSELPRASNLHPGFRSPHFRTFVMEKPPLKAGWLHLHARSSRSPKSIATAVRIRPGIARNRRHL